MFKRDIFAMRFTFASDVARTLQLVKLFFPILCCYLRGREVVGLLFLAPFLRRIIRQFLYVAWVWVLAGRYC